MKLLIDQNLSFRLVELLVDLYPGSIHARDVGLGAADDQAVWDFARQNGFAIVTKDFDFHQLSYFLGAPPKVIWIRRGTSTTSEIERLLRGHYADVLAFERDPDAALFALA